MKLTVKKVTKWTVAPFLLAACLAGCNDAKEGRVVATVGDAEITEAELNKLMTNQYGQSVLDALVTNKIVELEAKKKDIKISEEEIDAEYKAYEESFGGADALKESLESFNMTEEDIRADIRTYLLTIELMEEYIELTDEDVQAYFEENIDVFGSPEMIEASHILLEDEKTANEVLAKVNAGEDFAQLAKDYSVDSTNSEEGGSLGMFGRGEMVSEFEDVAFAMEIGDVSNAPVKTEYGYHIIKVTDKQDAVKADFEANKEEARQQLLEERIDSEYDAWIAEKQEEYDIQTYLFEEK